VRTRVSAWPLGARVIIAAVTEHSVGVPGRGTSVLARYVAWVGATALALALLQAGLEAVLVARAGAEPLSCLASGLLSGALTLLLVAAASPLLVAIAWAVERLRRVPRGAAWAESAPSAHGKSAAQSSLVTRSVALISSLHRCHGLIEYIRTPLIGS
jgi:hypothetical protein